MLLGLRSGGEAQVPAAGTVSHRVPCSPGGLRVTRLSQSHSIQAEGACQGSLGAGHGRFIHDTQRQQEHISLPEHRALGMLRIGTF